LGPKESKLREQRASNRGAEQATAPKAAKPKPEKPKSTAKPKAAKKAAKAKVQKKTAAKVDRSPATIGDFIVAAGEAGVEMSAIEKKFKMDAHPLRSKIFTARHKLGYHIEYVETTKRYVGRAPAAAKEAA
jgi:catalase (peroxidase I)